MWALKDKYKECCHNDACESFDTCIECWDEWAERNPPMTNGDRIRSMSDEELANFLLNVAYAGSDPWAVPFARKLCDNCPTVECKIQETGQTMDFHECDFADGKCPHGTDVVWWMRQPAEVSL